MSDEIKSTTPPNSSDVPPIPPNCPYFMMEGDDVACGMPDSAGKSSWPMPLKLADKYERGVIAAIAEVAWLREAERLDDLLGEREAMGSDLRCQEENARCCAKMWRDWSKS